MKIMQLDNKNSTDLEYLAQLGFEKIPCSEADLNDLRAKVRSRSFSYNSGSYFAFIGLIIGIFLGITVFFSLYTAPLSHIPFTAQSLQTQAPLKNDNEPIKLSTLMLDTVNFVKENFVREKKGLVIKITDTLTAVNTADSTSNLSSLPIQLSTLEPKISEPEIKYIINSPVIFIHDLKITDYSFLYFRKNKFVALNVKEGLNAAYANKEDLKKYGNVLEPSDNYYLHQALSAAMLQFKDQKYTKCISSLSFIAGFNENDINCRFYIGMAYFYKKNYSAALKNFEECISNSNNAFLQESEYYKGLCLLELGNKAEAQTLFKKIADDGGFYADKAKRFL